jgi:hypothetical protein
MPRQSDEETHFLNVDFDIQSRSDLAPLLAALRGQVSASCNKLGPRIYWIHGDLSGAPESADAAIRSLSSLISALPPTPRKLWDKAATREFDIGVESAMQPFGYEMVLSAEAVAAAAKVNARIRFTVYAPKVSDKVVKKSRPSEGLAGLSKPSFSRLPASRGRS